MYSLQFTVYSLQFAVNSLQSTVYSLQFTVYSLQFTVYSLQFTVYNSQFAVCRAMSEVCAVMSLPNVLDVLQELNFSSRKMAKRTYGPFLLKKIPSRRDGYIIIALSATQG